MLLGSAVGAALLIGAARRREDEALITPPNPSPAPAVTSVPANLDIIFKIENVRGNVVPSDIAKKLDREWATNATTKMIELCPFMSARSAPAIPVVSNPTVSENAFGTKLRSFPVTARTFVSVPSDATLSMIAECIQNIWIDAIGNAVGTQNAPTSITVSLKKL